MASTKKKTSLKSLECEITEMLTSQSTKMVELEKLREESKELEEKVAANKAAVKTTKE
jgi:hypothetical protein